MIDQLAVDDDGSVARALAGQAADVADLDLADLRPVLLQRPLAGGDRLLVAPQHDQRVL